jgi:hypothetical protein
VSAAVKLSQAKQADLPTMESVVEDLTHKLGVKENVADLVMVSMAALPNEMPSEFLRTYRSISDAGTNQQIKHLAHLLVTFLKDLGVLQLKPAAQKSEQPLTAKSSLVVTIDDLDNDDDLYENEGEFNGDNKSKLMRIKSEKMETLESQVSVSESLNASGKFGRTLSTSIASKPLPNLQSILPRCTNKTFKLAEVTANSAPQFTSESLEELLFKTHTRILGADGIFVL